MGLLYCIGKGAEHILSSVETYRKKLLAAGFFEASNPLFITGKNHFCKELSDKIAFVVNMKDNPSEFGIVYGIKSTAIYWNEREKAFFYENGVYDDDCTLRFYVKIDSQETELRAAEQIKALYEQALTLTKDSLLTISKDNRKAFIGKITDTMKPLGYRKKGNTWYKKLNNDVVLQLWADKNPYADLYWFEVDIYCKRSTRGLWCYSKRIKTAKEDRFDWKNSNTAECVFDWQLQSDELLRNILHRIIHEYLLPMEQTDLVQLGKQDDIQANCICPRDCCETCWIEKNLWEAKDSK